MVRSAVLPLGLLAVLYSFPGFTPSWAQSPQVAKFCPAPASEEVADVPYRKVIVDRIEFDKPVSLSSSEVAELVASANRAEFNAESPWVEEFAEIELRGSWQNRGYFKVAVSARAQSLGADSDSELFLVNVHIDEGPQYHLGTIQFLDGTAFQEWEFREAFPLREGEIFNVESVRVGIATLTKLYGSLGYIDFVAVPEVRLDDNLQRVSLVMRLDEQRQFRVGRLEIEGADPALEARLRSMIVPGDIFDPRVMEDFAKDNRSILPSRFPERMEARRNVRTGIVDVSFDLRPCSDANPQNAAGVRPNQGSQ
jgi:hypothetical protein